MADEGEDWRAVNRANWDERVPIHLAAPSYDLGPLRAGKGRLHPIEEAELRPVAGLRVLHLQCHFGRDTLTLAQRGAEVVGLDFSGPAIKAARALAAEIGLADRARFVEADLYDAPAAIREPGAFDLVFVTWGAIYWLPDIRRWAEIVAFFLKPGGTLYLAEGHPSALVFDDMAPKHDGLPGWFAPYFDRERARVRGSQRLRRSERAAEQPAHLQLDAPDRGDRHQRRRRGHDPEVAARARPGAVAHVRGPGRGRGRHVPLAQGAVAAAGLLAARRAQPLVGQRAAGAADAAVADVEGVDGAAAGELALRAVDEPDPPAAHGLDAAAPMVTCALR